jgi:hypothetical protein
MRSHKVDHPLKIGCHRFLGSQACSSPLNNPALSVAFRPKDRLVGLLSAGICRLLDVKKRRAAAEAGPSSRILLFRVPTRLRSRQAA